ncbi:hypothetical protein AVEN_257037-1 [Araneus ventricosus]|uniref:Uncharacterized protein n=1 Tax=Araneus ventricosus TaxID=182803 RepID=A0A4Y2M0E1_ARAVE|nr:hypothetical protein AVEN_257037-1 [Araneus ventricosus]
MPLAKISRLNTVTSFYTTMRRFAAKTGGFHSQTRVGERREQVTKLCRANMKSTVKEHGVMRRLTAAAFAVTEASVRALKITTAVCY